MTPQLPGVVAGQHLQGLVHGGQVLHAVTPAARLVPVDPAELTGLPQTGKICLKQTIGNPLLLYFPSSLGNGSRLFGHTVLTD